MIHNNINNTIIQYQQSICRILYIFETQNQGKEKYDVKIKIVQFNHHLNEWKIRSNSSIYRIGWIVYVVFVLVTNKWKWMT